MKKRPKTITLNKPKREALILQRNIPNTGLSSFDLLKIGKRKNSPHVSNRDIVCKTFQQVQSPIQFMKPTKKTSKTTNTTSFTPISTAETATQIFKDEVAKEKEESQSGCIAKFIAVMTALTNTKRSFTIEDAFSEARPFELHNSDIQYLWKKWIDVQQRLGRVEILENSCYDSPLVIVCA